jgi:hypothetical protein
VASSSAAGSESVVSLLACLPQRPNPSSAYACTAYPPTVAAIGVWGIKSNHPKWLLGRAPTFSRVNFGYNVTQIREQLASHLPAVLRREGRKIVHAPDHCDLRGRESGAIRPNRGQSGHIPPHFSTGPLVFGGYAPRPSFADHLLMFADNDRRKKDD